MKVKGFRVNPEELESQLLKHADVADCCVVPIPDEFSGELPKAFVVLTQDARSRIGTDAAQTEKLQAALIQVRYLSRSLNYCTSGLTRSF
jgi:acyl-coenzyme A synthetase/AMP-(fatty) acid ligase